MLTYTYVKVNQFVGFFAAAKNSLHAMRITSKMLQSINQSLKVTSQASSSERLYLGTVVHADVYHI